MIVAEQLFTPHPNVVFTRMDDARAVLLDLTTKRYYTLNETGLRIWEALQGGATPSHIAQALEEEYETTQKEAEGLVLAFLDLLLQEELVQQGESVSR